jgi:hypothetical protein
MSLSEILEIGRAKASSTGLTALLANMSNLHNHALEGPQDREPGRRL